MASYYNNNTFPHKKTQSMRNCSWIQACMKLDKLRNWASNGFKITVSICKASPRQNAAGWVTLGWWCSLVTTKNV